MKKKFDGRTHLLGNDVNAGQLLPSKYLLLNDPSEMAPHILEGYECNFPKPPEKGSILVAGKNFGCGTWHEQIAMALKATGITCIIASSFSRSFYRSAVNHGLPLIECDDAHSKIAESEIITIDFENGEIILKNDILKFKVLPEVIVKILSSGGLIPLVRKSLGK